MSEGRRYASIGLAMVLMAASVWVVGELLLQARSEHRAPVVSTTRIAPFDVDGGQFAGLDTPRRPAPTAPAEPATLADRASRRAFHGAPPAIPHLVDSEISGSDSCASCHRFGGWSPRFEAMAPQTPHPELVACRQCHVAQTEGELFVPTDWPPLQATVLEPAALPGSPPVMPHSLDMRSNCLGCHGGTDDLRTTHPERAGCLQCHVGQVDAGDWHRSALVGGNP